MPVGPGQGPKVVGVWRGDRGLYQAFDSLRCVCFNQLFICDGRVVLCGADGMWSSCKGDDHVTIGTPCTAGRESFIVYLLYRLSEWLWAPETARKEAASW